MGGVSSPASDTYYFLNKSVAWKVADASSGLWRLQRRRRGERSGPFRAYARRRLRRRRSWLVCGNRAAAGSSWVTSTARSMAAQAGRWSHAPRHPLAARRHRSHCRGLRQDAQLHVAKSRLGAGMVQRRFGGAVHERGRRCSLVCPFHGAATVRAAAPSDGLCCGEGSAPSRAWPSSPASSISDDDRNDHGHRYQLDRGASWRAYSFRNATVLETALVDSRHWRLTDGEPSWPPMTAAPLAKLATLVSMRDATSSVLSLQFLTPDLGFAYSVGDDGPLWWTRDGGATWRPFRIIAGPSFCPLADRAQARTEAVTRKSATRRFAARRGVRVCMSMWSP